MQSPWTALRTACLTGVVHRKMAEPIDTPDQKELLLTAGDLDEAVSGLLTNRLVASDADGTSVPAGFTRIAAFRGGVHEAVREHEATPQVRRLVTNEGTRNIRFYERNNFRILSTTRSNGVRIVFMGRQLRQN